MKIALSLAGLALACCTAASAELDKGGVTFDFEKISAKRFAQAATTGENLITNADFSKQDDPKDPLRWMDSYCYIHNADRAKVDPWRPKVRDMVKWTLADGVATIAKSPELENLCGQVAENVSGGWVKHVRLPNTNGGVYKLSGEYQAAHTGKFPGASYILAQMLEDAENPAKGKPLGGLRVLNMSGTGNSWAPFSHELTVPQGAATVSLVFRIDGVGELKIRNPSLRPEKSAEMLSLKLAPHGFLDKTFALSQNDPAVMTFAWKRNGAAAECKLSKPELVVELPKDVEFVDSTTMFPLKSSKDVKIEGKDYRELRIGLETVARRPAVIDGYDFYMVLPVQVTTALSTDSRPGRGFCRVEDGGKAVSNIEDFDFTVIPKIQAKSKCSTYQQGIYVGGLYYNFNAAGREKLAKFLGDTGTQWISSGGAEPEKVAAWRKNGVKTITPELYFVANGYRIGDPKDRPETDKYKFMGSSSDYNLNNATCPAAVYQGRPFFKEKVAPMLAKHLAGCDGLWANWEPYMFDGRGCYCDTCRDEFANFAKISKEEAAQVWKTGLVRGGPHYETGLKFRSWQHAKMVLAIDEEVRKVTGNEKSVGFIPGVAWILMASCRESHGHEHAPIDYAGKLRWIDPWGPYPCWPSQTPYVYSRGSQLKSLVIARDVVAQVRKDYPSGARPKLQALPHGIQCDAWVTQPEALEMDFISFFLAGYDASTAYIFPRGYDNRYWAGFARSAEKAAEFERFVLEGKSCDNLVQVTAASPFAPPVRRLDSWLPTVKNVPLLQSVSYKLGDRHLVAVANFWEKGRAFVTMKLSGLDPKAKYQIFDGRDLFAADGRDHYTGKEIADGVPLHVGAMRWAFYTIAPAGSVKADTAWTPSKLAKQMAEEKESLAAAVEMEKKNDALYSEEESKLTALDNGKLSCKPDGEDALVLESGDNKARLNTSVMSVVSWKVGNVDVVAAEGNSGLGQVAFWEPSVMFKEPYRVTKQEKVGDKIRVVAEKKVNALMSKDLEYLLIRQIHTFDNDLRRVEIVTELVNNSSDEAPRVLSAGMRYHMFPAAAAAKGGKIVMKNAGGNVEHVRNFSRMLYSTGDATADAVLRKTFEIAAPTVKIDEPKARFAFPNLQVDMALEPANLFRGFALWDGASLPTTTFEPFFAPVTLKNKGDKALFKMDLQIK